MTLPIFQDQNRNLTLLQTTWATSLNPLIKNPINHGIFLKEVSLVNGVNVINHLLSRNQQGWIITDRNGAATIYRSAPLNSKTLTLTSNASVIIDLYVF